MKLFKPLSRLFVVLLLAMATSVKAQPPQYLMPIGGTNFCFPFGSSATYYKTQFLYFPSDFTVPPPTGAITKLYVVTNSVLDGTAAATNLTVKIGMTAATGLTTTYVTTGMVTGYTAANHTFPAAAIGAWIPITLSNPVPYTAGSNLIVEFEISNRTGATFCLSRKTGTGSIPRIAYGPYQAVTAGGVFSDYIPDLGLDVQTGPPCPAPTGPYASNVLWNSATVGWNAVPGSVGYEYLVDQNPTYVYAPSNTIPTNNTSINLTGLLPSTTYYLHVRNMCSPTNPSPWVDHMFTTLPPCSEPTGFFASNVKPNSATIQWSPLLSALSWDYVINNDRNDPTAPTGATNVTAPTDNISGLAEDTWYYVHIRTNCTGDQSGWSLDSFLTPIVCKAPDVKISNVNVDEAVAYWEPVTSSFEYEYAISSSPTPPVAGTRYQHTSLHTPVLSDGKNYYVHVRAHCNSLGTISYSPWTTATFRTWPTAVQNVNSSNFDMEAYPNPASDVVTIELLGNIADNATITLTDVTGRVLRTQAVTDKKTTLNISTLPAGNYQLKYADVANNRVIKINKR